MAREKLAVGPIKAEGPRSTVLLWLLLAVGLGAAFYLGTLTNLLNSCFGLKP